MLLFKDTAYRLEEPRFTRHAMRKKGSRLLSETYAPALGLQCRCSQMLPKPRKRKHIQISGHSGRLSSEYLLNALMMTSRD